VVVVTEVFVAEAGAGAAMAVGEDVTVLLADRWLVAGQFVIEFVGGAHGVDPLPGVLCAKY
jgi:hypothetical protein